MPCCSQKSTSKIDPLALTPAASLSTATPPWGVLNTTTQSSNQIKHSEITSYLDGPSLGELLQCWKDAAVSTARINSLEILNRKKLGLKEIEQFSLGLRHSFKSEKLQRGKGKPVEGVIAATMKVKIRDEKQNRRELEKRKEELKRCLARRYHPKNKTYCHQIPSF